MKVRQISTATCLNLLLICGMSFAEEDGMREPGGPEIFLRLVAKSDTVRKELSISEAQQKQLNTLHDEILAKNLEPDTADGERIFKQIESILKPAQLARLQEIFMQAVGGASLKSSRVAKSLGLSEAQRKVVTQIWDEEQHRLKDSLSRVFFKSKKDRDAYIDKKHKQAGDRLVKDVLTNQQREQFDKIKGERFDVGSLPAAR